MHRLLLHHHPAACSRVVLIALEEMADAIGVPFEDRGVALLRGAQRLPEFLAISPRGKVPVLMVDGTPITETAVILHHLAATYPQARLLPSTGNAASNARGLTDLVWCSGVLHPLSHRIFRPGAYTLAEPEAVKAAALAQFGVLAGEIGARIESGGWWYGDTWSIVDAYLCWVYSSAADHGFALAAHPALVEHRMRVESRPSFGRALAREQAAVVRDRLAAAAMV